MSQAHAQLARLEITFNKGEISREKYTRQKWEILQLLPQSKEILKPVFRDKRSRKIQDSRGTWFNFIPPGPFIFGSDNGYGELRAGIYMGSYPVTVKEFRRFLENSDWDYPQSDLEKMLQVCPDPNCPVSHVSWNDAKEYCRWLRRETTEYYSLPNEYEWESAARGIDGRLYPWGYDKPGSDFACFQGEKHYESTIPVGSFLNNKSPYGCMDMVGNVWEWLLDDLDDPREPHILRGGSWRNDVQHATCISQAYGYPPEKRIDYGGFRIIYLPEDMWEEYRKHIDLEIEAPTASLEVIGHGLDLSGAFSAEPGPALETTLPAMPATQDIEQPQTPAVTTLPKSYETKKEADVDASVLPTLNFKELKTAPQPNAPVAKKTLRESRQKERPKIETARYDDLVFGDSVEPIKRVPTPKEVRTERDKPNRQTQPKKGAKPGAGKKAHSSSQIRQQKSPISNDSSKKSDVSRQPSRADAQAEVDQIISAEGDAQSQLKPTSKTALYAVYGFWSVSLLLVLVIFIYKIVTL